MDKVLVAGPVVCRAFLRDDGESATGTGKAGAFGKAAKLDGHLPRTLYLINRFRQGFVTDERLVRGIEENQRLVLPGIVDPGF